MKSLIKGYGREKRLGCTVLDDDENGGNCFHEQRLCGHTL
jgi:hypothetical protein